jgi:NitT/TauT family transport system substrate-binding protein
LKPVPYLHGVEGNFRYIPVPGIDRGLPLACIAGGHVEGTVIIAGSGIQPLAAFNNMPEFLSQFSGKAIGTPRKDLSTM